ELVDLKNQTEHMIHETEKQLEEHKDKLSEEDIQAIEAAKEELKSAAEGSDKAALEAALQTFQTKAQKLGEVIYAEAQQEAQAAQAGQAGQEGPGAGCADGGTCSDSNDEPVDADFEVKA
ncbi:MAG: Hsp70 family protein, partial [Planctomycetota bacterium]|nr:Hsp70 family protein [Planctomycetota bacterium]